MLSHKTSLTFQTQKTLSTWGPRPACTFWVCRIISKKTGHWMSWNKNHIKNKLYHVESYPQETNFYTNISDVKVIPTLPVTENSAHISCVVRIHKGFLKNKTIKAAVWVSLAFIFTISFQVFCSVFCYFHQNVKSKSTCAFVLVWLSQCESNTSALWAVKWSISLTNFSR